MIFPYTWPPWVMREIINKGKKIQNTFVGKRVHKVENKKIVVTHYGDTTGEKVKLPIRVYSPEGDGPFPIVLFYHGGGFTFCSIESHDSICRTICKYAACVVISVEYRLAPEFKYPIPVEDVYASSEYISRHASDYNGDKTQIVVAGDSAGGNMSAVICQLSRDRGGPSFAGQLLIYPSCDLTMKRYPSHSGKCLNLTESDSMWFLNNYIPDVEKRAEPRASPLYHPNLTNLPPALIITGDLDRIRDTGEAYGHALSSSGVPCIIQRYQNVGHGFLLVSPGEEAKSAFELMGSWLINIFSSRHQSYPPFN